MLDFYYIDDGDLTPEYPDESNYIGGITLQQYDLIRELIIFAKSEFIKFSFFEDFRITLKQVKILYNFSQKHLLTSNKFTVEKIKAYEKLCELFCKSIKRQKGVICFVD